MSVDLSDFAGPVLNGAVEGNSVVLKIYKPSEEMEYSVTATWGTGNGVYGDLILAASELTVSTGYDVAINEFFTRAASKFSCTDDERPTISEKQGEYFTSFNPFKLIPDASKSSRVCIAGVAEITQQYPSPTISSPLTKDQRSFF